jgi:hypothetical protein
MSTGAAAYLFSDERAGAGDSSPARGGRASRRGAETEAQRDQRLDAVLARMEADIRAARDMLGIYDQETVDDAPHPAP